jgi:hypothetical protein
MSPDPIAVEMAHNKAIHLWNMGTQEKVMAPDEYPPAQTDFDFSGFNGKLADALRKLLGEADSPEQKLALWTNAVARQLVFRPCAKGRRNPAIAGKAWMAIAAEAEFIGPDMREVDELVGRWLLMDAGNRTDVFVSTFDRPRWISQREAPLLAVGISMNLPHSESQRRSNDVTWECYVNTQEGHAIAVFGAV